MCVMVISGGYQPLGWTGMTTGRKWLWTDPEGDTEGDPEDEPKDEPEEDEEEEEEDDDEEDVESTPVEEELSLTGRLATVLFTTATQSGRASGRARV